VDLATIFTIATLALTSFLATNLDNLLLLVFLLGSSAQRRAAVLLGYLSSVIVVVFLAAAGVALGLLIEPAFIGYLGIAPMAMGFYLLYQRREVSPPDERSTWTGLASEGRLWLASAILMTSNSGDSLALVLPLLAESERGALLLIIGVYLFSSLLWCALALSIAARPGLAQRIQERGVCLVPWMMIAVGIYVLMDTGTDTLH
jgi:cadmium resistance protein CadD (predicted permease)